MPIKPTIACVVEGHAEVEAVPLLLRRLASKAQHFDINIPQPVRCSRSKFIRGDSVEYIELERAMKLAAMKLPSPQGGGILVLVDADEACPADVGKKLRDTAKKIRPDVATGIVLAKREYETWFVAAIESLRGKRGIRTNAEPPTDPESISDAKGYLKSQMESGRTYSPTRDQPAMTHLFDMKQALKCRSFTKFKKEVEFRPDSKMGVMG